MLFEQILFFLAGAGAIGGALGVVMLRNPFFSVLSLVAHLISLSILFLLLSAAFLAAAQVVVYAGAVMVLYVFVVAYIGGDDEDQLRLRPTGPAAVLAPLFAAALLIELTIAIVGSSLTLLDTRGAEVGDGFGSPGAIGDALLTQFLLAFEAASFLLLIAAVGAVMIAGRQRGLHPHPEEAISVADVVRRPEVGSHTEAS